jgi:hypothetical protein
MTDDYTEIISKVCKRFGGLLPATSDELFLDAVMAGLACTTLRGKPEPELDAFRTGLRLALSDLRLAQTVTSEMVN